MFRTALQHVLADSLVILLEFVRLNATGVMAKVACQY